jgi:hypothetical protein
MFEVEKFKNAESQQTNKKQYLAELRDFDFDPKFNAERVFYLCCLNSKDDFLAKTLNGNYGYSGSGTRYGYLLQSTFILKYIIKLPEFLLVIFIVFVE